MLFLGPKTSVEVKPGETLLLKTPGGGGYGDLDCGENCHVNEKIDVKLTEYKNSLVNSKGSVNEYKLIQESA